MKIGYTVYTTEKEKGERNEEESINMTQSMCVCVCVCIYIQKALLKFTSTHAAEKEIDVVPAQHILCIAPPLHVYLYSYNTEPRSR